MTREELLAAREQVSKQFERIKYSGGRRGSTLGDSTDELRSKLTTILQEIDAELQEMDAQKAKTSPGTTKNNRGAHGSRISPQPAAHSRIAKRLFQFIVLVALGVAVLLMTRSCDYGPQVEGGQPRIAQELVIGRGGKFGYNSPATVHYYEVSETNRRHPDELKAFFRFRCRETYIPPVCEILVWPTGTAPHSAMLFASDKATEVAYYYLNKTTDVEKFEIYKQSR